MRKRKAAVVKQEKPVNVQNAQIISIECGDIEFCRVGSCLPRVKRLDTAIAEEVEQQFESGQIVEISFDDEAVRKIEKVEAA